MTLNNFAASLECWERQLKKAGRLDSPTYLNLNATSLAYFYGEHFSAGGRGAARL